MSEFESQKNIKALVWTIGVHGVLFVACLFFGFTSLPPLPNQDLGMEVNLGTSTQGKGDVQPLNPNPPALTPSRPAVSKSSPAPKVKSSQTEDIATQDKEEAPVIKRSPDIKHDTVFSKNLEEAHKPIVAKTVPVNVPVQPKPVPPKPKALYSGGVSRNDNNGNNAGASNDSRNEGLTGQPGDQGAVNGNPTASNHNGTFSGLGGNSLSYRLNGRNIIAYPGKEGDFSEPGEVRLSIKVDQQGNIIDATVISAANETIRELALRKIKQVQFNSDPNAPVVQFGDITFIFKIQR